MCSTPAVFVTYCNRTFLLTRLKKTAFVCFLFESDLDRGRKMMGKLVLVLLAMAWSQVTAYNVPTPTIRMLPPSGIRFSIQDEPGISLVAYHYNIGFPLDQVDAGQYNVDVTSPKDGYWIHENRAIPSHLPMLGQTIYYWVLVIYNDAGYTLTDRIWSEPIATLSPGAPPADPKTTVQPTTSSGTATNQPKAPGGSVTPGCSSYPCDSSCDMSVMPCNGMLFEDTFGTLNMDVWEHEITAGGGGNWEFQYYTNNRSNSYVRDNTLFLKPTLTSDRYGDAFITSGTLDLWGAAPADLCTGNAFYGCQRTGSGSNPVNPIQSARLRTVNSFAFTYGKVEVVAKLPAGDWLWPAIWLLPKRNGYGGWPASGEIDMVESRGNRNLFDSNGVNAGVNQMGSTMHWGPYWPFNAWPKTHATKNLATGHFGDAFHKYGMEWTSNGLKFFVDDELLLNADPGANGFWEFGEFEADAPGTDNPWKGSTSKVAPFDQEFYIILNVAVGGTNYFSDGLTNQPYAKPWSNDSPTAASDFWNAKDDWYPTWNPDVNNGEDAAMQVKSVRVWAV
ncbi:beta-1,3-glucan-binding protein-like isoform X2 [Asterias amurensis]|uniref:beta-1,3-glucan-binding protein-like isoform X2 n=1 Tax=Asterias amurensis TaxID=7602 RepID=UPI003AB5C66B